MKAIWKQIEKTVRVAPLSESERIQVLENLDSVIGKYFIDGKYPIEKLNLSENEFVVYKDILESLNSKIIKVIDDKTYNKAVIEIFSLIKMPNSNQKKILNLMDDAYEAGNWTEVNKHIQSLNL